MVHKNRIGLRRHCRFYQRQAGSNAGNDFSHLGLAFDLQTVRSVVLEALGLQQLVESRQQFITRSDKRGRTLFTSRGHGVGFAGPQAQRPTFSRKGQRTAGGTRSDKRGGSFQGKKPSTDR